MSKKQQSGKPQTQYVAKVRYSNNLPPPACPPKLLNDAEIVKDDEFKGMLSSYFKRHNFRNMVKLDDNLGMNMNILEMADPAGVYGLNNGGVPLQLHEADQILLTDPTKKVATKSENVGFLRRTQYISSDQSSAPQQALDGMKMRREEEFNPKSIVKAVEDTFEGSLGSLDVANFRHPTRKQLKAKRVWSILPDSAMFDKRFVDIKFVSSASIEKNATTDEIKTINDPKLATAILREIELNKTTKLVSLYTAQSEDAATLHKTINEATENAPISAQDDAMGETFTFAKHRDYAGTLEPLESSRHLALAFTDDVVYYVPIDGKLELRKSRVDPDLIPVLKRVSHDKINLRVREPTFEELAARDRARAPFDPMEFGGE